MERIDKIFSRLGLLSRSECKKAVRQGLISVNSRICSSADEKADPDKDIIEYKGNKIDTASKVYYMLHKPEGVITAKEDKLHPTVFGLIEDTRRDLATAGRLDKDTTGLLLITNDGELSHRLLSPGKHVSKRYIALIDGKLTEEGIKALEEGIDIGDDTRTLPAKVDILNNELPQSVALTITEGRYHQVKRMFAALNCPVLKLHRSDFGELHLDESLAPGQYRPLTAEELRKLKP